MTLSPPPVEHEPDHELDRQAALEGLTTRTANAVPTGPPSHDNDAEIAALASMLDSLEACAVVIEQGLEPRHFYSQRHAAIYTAICDTLTAGDKPEAYTVSPRIRGYDIPPPDVYALTLGHHLHRNAKAYANRILACAQARNLQGHALEVAAAAQAGQLDEALRRLTKLTDDLPSESTDGSWAPLDLTDVLNGTTTAPVPDLLAVDGAPALFYTGRTNLVFGESGNGKTWVALAALAEVIRNGRTGIYIDLEDTMAGLVARLILLGLTTEQIRAGLLYVQPDSGWSPTAQATIAATIDRHDVALVVMDSTGEAMAADGVKGNDDDDVARWFTAGPKFIARRGPAVIIIDHVPKDNQHAPLDPIGSQRKKAAIDGAGYRIDAPKAPSIDHDGLLVAVTSKDRHGHHTRGQKAAAIAVTHDPDGLVVLTFSAPEKAPVDASGNFRPTVLMERASRTIEDTPGLSQIQVVTRTTGKAKVVREAIRCLIVEGFVEVDPTPGRFAYRSIKPFRAADHPVDNTQNEDESDDL